MSLVRFRPEAPPADLAHLVERDLAKVEVAGSSPVIRSIDPKATAFGSFVFPPACAQPPRRFGAITSRQKAPVGTRAKKSALVQSWTKNKSARTKPEAGQGCPFLVAMRGRERPAEWHFSALCISYYRTRKNGVRQKGDFLSPLGLPFPAFSCRTSSGTKSFSSFRKNLEKALDKPRVLCYNIRALSQGRSDCFPRDHDKNGLVAQLVRALACHARGRGFEPHAGRQFMLL